MQNSVKIENITYTFFLTFLTIISMTLLRSSHLKKPIQILLKIEGRRPMSVLNVSYLMNDMKTVKWYRRKYQKYLFRAKNKIMTAEFLCLPFCATNKYLNHETLIHSCHFCCISIFTEKSGRRYMRKQSQFQNNVLASLFCSEWYLTSDQAQ